MNAWFESLLYKKSCHDRVSVGAHTPFSATQHDGCAGEMIVLYYVRSGNYSKTLIKVNLDPQSFWGPFVFQHIISFALLTPRLWHVQFISRLFTYAVLKLKEIQWIKGFFLTLWENNVLCTYHCLKKVILLIFAWGGA